MVRLYVCIYIYTPITVKVQRLFIPRFRAHFRRDLASQSDRLPTRLEAGSERSWGRLALVLGSPGAVLGPSWGLFGPPRGHLGVM